MADLTFVVIRVERAPGGRLSNGQLSGLGGETTYRVGLTTDGRDFQPLGHPFAHQRKAQQYARLIESKLGNDDA